MVVRTPQLDDLREFIRQTSGVFLRNTRHVPNVTCEVCTGSTKDGWPNCWNCNQLLGRVGIADRLGFLIYGWNGSQAGRTMYAYKSAAGAPTSYERVSALLTYAVAAHWPCIARGASTPDAWAIVPSLSGRTGVHPLAHIAGGVIAAIPEITISPAPTIVDPRQFHPENFIVAPTNARHVLLLDDTWTRGGHLQSASAALKAAGAQRVTGLTIARWLDPGFADTQQFIEGLHDDFEPLICPYTGDYC